MEVSELLCNSTGPRELKITSILDESSPGLGGMLTFWSPAMQLVSQQLVHASR